MRSVQGRKNRMQIINQLFRKHGRRHYRFSESRLKERIANMLGEKLNESPKRMDSMADEESPLTRQETIKSRTSNLKRRQTKVINVGAENTQTKTKKMSPRSVTKSSKSSKHKKHQFSSIDVPPRNSQTLYNPHKDPNSPENKTNQGSFAYNNYALGSTYHIVKNPKNLSMDYKGHFEIVPNTVSNQNRHLQSIEFSK